MMQNNDCLTKVKLLVVTKAIYIQVVNFRLLELSIDNLEMLISHSITRCEVSDWTLALHQPR